MNKGKSKSPKGAVTPAAAKNPAVKAVRDNIKLPKSGSKLDSKIWRGSGRGK